MNDIKKSTEREKGRCEKLYKLFIYINNTLNDSIYVVAKTETEASELVIGKWHEWGYWQNVYVGKIELIAEERKFGRPHKLLVSRRK